MRSLHEHFNESIKMTKLKELSMEMQDFLDEYIEKIHVDGYSLDDENQIITFHDGIGHDTGDFLTVKDLLAKMKKAGY